MSASSISQASWNNAGYNDFTLNAAGLAQITKGGISKFGLREVTYDVGNVDPNTVSPGSDCYSYVVPKSSNQGGTTNDPKLVVIYTTGSSQNSAFFTVF